jgi:osmoprotectant transport system substrate-binding protein
MSRTRPAISPRPASILGAALAVALACGACGTATPSTTVRASSPATRSAASTTASTASSTTSTATTATTTISTLPGAGKPAVTIGDKNYTEQFVLGQLYLQALEAQGFAVTVNQNIGPTEVTRQALKTGALAMYPEYLDVFDSAMAGYRHGFRSRGDAYRAAVRYASGQGLVLLHATPFSDTDAIAVTVAFAGENHLRSIFGLRRVGGTLTMGGAAQLGQLAPGLPTLESVYGVTPVAFRALPVGGQYAPMDGGTIQAAYVDSTDGQLASGDYRLLDDQRHIFGWGNVVPVVSAALLAREGPAFAETVERVDATLTTPVMRQLNSAVDVAKQDPAAVAKQFLETHGLLTPLTGP